MMKNIQNNFLKCGVIGWGLEIFWTGLGSFFRKDHRLTGHSSILMFPIYGMAALIGPASRLLHKQPPLIRGLFYMNGIFLVEYLTGSYLKKKDLCPWDYSHTPFHYHGVIRLDYAPVWFFTGLLYEKILA